MRKKKERKQKSAPVKGNKKLIIIAAAVLLVAVAALVAFKLLGGKGEEGKKEEDVIEPEVIEAPMLYELGDLKLPALPVLNSDIIVTKEEVPGLVPAEEEQPVVLETANSEKPDEESDEKSDEEPEEKPEEKPAESAPPASVALGLLTPAISSANARPASTSPPTVFKITNSPSTSGSSSISTSCGMTCSYFVVFCASGARLCPSIVPITVRQ